jgi:hypothetical protein
MQCTEVTAGNLRRIGEDFTTVLLSLEIILLQFQHITFRMLRNIVKEPKELKDEEKIKRDYALEGRLA